MQLFFYALTCLMAIVVLTDATRFIIPNWLVGMMLLLWPVMLFMTPVSFAWYYSLAVMLGVFALGYVIFMLSIMGGGDIKLLTACALWCGLPALAEFLFITAILGGILAMMLLITRWLLAYFMPVKAAAGSLPKLFTNGAPVPYGLAIATAFTWLLWHQKLPGLVI